MCPLFPFANMHLTILCGSTIFCWAGRVTVRKTAGLAVQTQALWAPWRALPVTQGLRTVRTLGLDGTSRSSVGPMEVATTTSFNPCVPLRQSGSPDMPAPGFPRSHVWPCCLALRCGIEWNDVCNFSHCLGKNPASGLLLFSPLPLARMAPMRVAWTTGAATSLGPCGTTGSKTAGLERSLF